MLFDSVIDLFSYVKRDKYLVSDEAWVKDAANLPPREWADGKMHEKVNNTWREVPENKQNKPAEEKSDVQVSVSKHGAWYHASIKNSNGDLLGIIRKKNEAELNSAIDEFKKNKGFKTESKTPVATPQTSSLNNSPKEKSEKKETKQTLKKKPLSKETKIKLSQVTKTEKSENKKHKSPEPKGLQSDVNRSKTNGIERLQLAKDGMPEGYGTTTVPAGNEVLESYGVKYNSYTKIREIDKYLRPRALDYYSHCSEDVVGMLHFYTLGGDSIVNGAKRGNIDETPLVKKCIDNMDEAFKNAPELGTDMVCYRYTDPIEIGNALGLKDNVMTLQQSALGYWDKNISDIEKAFKKLIGKEFTNPAYCSTNANKNVVDRGARQFVLRIKVSKEHKGLYLSPIANKKFAQADTKNITRNSENEILFNAGSKFRIDGVSSGEMPYHVLGNMTRRCVVDVTML